MTEPVWYEDLPEEFWTWYESIKMLSTEIVSLTIRVKRSQVSLDYLDIYGKPKRAKFLIDRSKYAESN
jgi:hypothetical protein